jgi:HPr kinase/phosphorylase
MKPALLNAELVFEDHVHVLQWQWIAAQTAGKRHFDIDQINLAQSGADLVGHLNYIHPYRLQVLGRRELDHITGSGPIAAERRIKRLIKLEPPMLVLADDQQAPPVLTRLCETSCIPLFSTIHSSAYVIDVLRAYLSRHFADYVNLHGVFMDIFGLGVLLSGESGLGKSELGLELISRGHGLVADDSVDFYRISQDAIEGRCPELLENMLEVRGIGILDIRTIFGETAVRRKMRLKLIVQLVRSNNELEKNYERIPTAPVTTEVLGLSILTTVMPVVAGRNMAVLVEAAVRNTILQLRGIFTYEEFIARQQQAMVNKSSS